ncbi:MAG TPA: hypothetical protein VID26_06720 [Candidatus Limnocylindrales bacterium]
MTPLRPRTAGTVRLPLLLAAGLLVLSGCGLGTPTTAPATAGGTSQPPSLSPSTEPSVGPSVPPSDEPSASASAGPSPSEVVEPSPSEAGESPSPSSSAAVCSGAKDTPDFYEAFAGSVSFPVYCAVLPAGWSLVSGQYRLANGGHITISFRRKADNATFELDEGSFCADSTGCVPAGTASGSGPFGDLSGNLVQTSSGFALVVAKGEKPSWLAIGNGLDQAAFLALTGALHAVN